MFLFPCSWSCCLFGDRTLTCSYRPEVRVRVDRGRSVRGGFVIESLVGFGGSGVVVCVGWRRKRWIKELKAIGLEDDGSKSIKMRLLAESDAEERWIQMMTVGNSCWRAGNAEYVV